MSFHDHERCAVCEDRIFAIFANFMVKRIILWLGGNWNNRDSAGNKVATMIEIGEKLPEQA